VLYSFYTHADLCKIEQSEVDVKLTFTKRSFIWGAKLSALYNTTFEQRAIIVLGHIKTCLPQTRTQ